MRRPDPTPRQKQRFITASQFRYRMELVIECDRPISVLKGREAARKILDSLTLEAGPIELPEGFGSARVRCSELRRVLEVKTEEASS